MTSYTIDVSAMASFNGNDDPIYELLVDGTIEATGTISSETPVVQAFTVTAAAAIAHIISVSYINHTSSAQMLDIVSVSVNGVTIPTAVAGEDYVSAQGTYDQWGQMYFGGQINIPVPAADFPAAAAGSTPPPASGTPTTTTTTTTTGTTTGDTPTAGTTAYAIGVQADASFGDGNYPIFNVLVDGTQVGTGTVNSNNVEGFSFTASLAAGVGHQLQIVYTNHASSAELLNVQSVSINGQTISSSSAAETYVWAGGTATATGQMYFGGTLDFTLPAADFPASASASAPASPPTGSTPSAGGGTSTPSPGQAVYVAASGSDGNTGTQASPFATLGAAIKAMEGLGIHTVYLEGGTYAVGSTITLGAADSGDQILAAAGTTPVLSATGGTAALLSLNGASDVTISGITFQNAAANPQQAALTLTGASGNTISHDSFVDNAEAVLLAAASSGNSLTDDLMAASSGSAIEVKDGSNNNTISYDQINGVGALTTQGGGVYVHGVSGLTITHTLIENTAGAGITLADFAPGETTLSDETVTDNIVTNTGTDATTSDYGAIYDLGRTGNLQNTLIEDNYVHGVGGGNPNAHAEGIYLDDLASGVTVEGNIVDGLNGSSDAMEIHGGTNETVENNIFNLQSLGRAAIYFAAPPADFPGTATPFAASSITGNVITSDAANPAGAYADFDSTAYSGPLLTAIHGNDYWMTQNPGAAYPMGNLADSAPSTANPGIVLASQAPFPYPAYAQSGASGAPFSFPSQQNWGLDGASVGA
jgi:hypothetical protein